MIESNTGGFLMLLSVGVLMSNGLSDNMSIYQRRKSVSLCNSSLRMQRFVHAAQRSATATVMHCSNGYWLQMEAKKPGPKGKPYTLVEWIKLLKT